MLPIGTKQIHYHALHRRCLQIVRALDKALASDKLERVASTIDQFERHFKHCMGVKGPGLWVLRVFRGCFLSYAQVVRALDKALASNNLERVASTDGPARARVSLGAFCSFLEGFFGSRVMVLRIFMGLVMLWLQIVRALDRALASNNLERVASTMDQFERQFESLDVQSRSWRAP